MTTAVAHPYAADMSPRVNRDVDAIGVEIDSPSIGNGTEAEGGGPLRGGLTLANRFTAVITDPEVPYEITMSVRARDGWLACERVELSEQPGGPAINGAAVRGITLSLYLQRIRQELGQAAGFGLILKEVSRTERTVGFDLPLLVLGDELEAFNFGQMRRAVHATKITPEMAAEAYLEALASPDPEQNRRPTAAAADKLGASRGHISRLISEARKNGIPGLGPGRPARRKDAQ